MGSNITRQTNDTVTIRVKVRQLQGPMQKDEESGFSKVLRATAKGIGTVADFAKYPVAAAAPMFPGGAVVAQAVNGMSVLNDFPGTRVGDKIFGGGPPVPMGPYTNLPGIQLDQRGVMQVGRGTTVRNQAVQNVLLNRRAAPGYY